MVLFHQLITLSLLLFVQFNSLNAQKDFSQLFMQKSLRIDFQIGGNRNLKTLHFEKIVQGYLYAGPYKTTVDTSHLGDYIFIMKELKTKRPIFQSGFSSLFNEWQTTSESKTINRSFQQTVIAPWPKNSVQLEIISKEYDGTQNELFSFLFDPDKYLFEHQKQTHCTIDSIVIHGPPNKCIDILLVSEGYTSNEQNRFNTDCRQLINAFFKDAPFSEFKTKFNIRTLFAASEESGITDPNKNQWKNTLFNASFNTLNTDRYLQATNTWLIHNYAATTYYDQIFIIVNSSKYGGGGIFNHFSITSAQNQLAAKVFSHEFCHTFAGLADEYFYTEPTYINFYNLNIEPWAPNLTTLKKFKEKEWFKMISSNMPIPTPATAEFKDSIGIFEGGGYSTHGLYRPFLNCRMKTNEAPSYCPVCQKAIEKMIFFLTE